MSLVCSHCSRTIEFSGDPPRFCAYCGQTLSTPGPDAPTLAYDPTPPTLTAGAAAALPPAPAGASAAVPECVGGYKLLRTLGGGGMGTVYEAEQLTTGRHVAIKLIAPQYATSRDTVERFRQEGRLASAIAHPRCVFVVAADEDAGRPYIVMELMPGDTLDDLIRREGPLPPKKAIHKILDVIDGLQEAHRLGVIHRDVKPSNCFLDKDGRVKVGDFGLSKSLVSDQQLTKTGSFLGTVLYSSPEQVRREQLDQQTDVYSVAATLYFLLTGRAPYQTGDAMATIAQILADPPTPPRQVRPDLPEALEAVVLKGLDRNRERRYRDLGEFRDALLPFLQRDLGIGSVGWRLLAYLIDVAILFLMREAMSIVAIGMWGEEFWSKAGNPQTQIALQQEPFMKVLQCLHLLIWPVYFALLEGMFGCTVGKWLLRLRVFAADRDDPAGWGRILLRTLICFGLLHTGDMLGLLAVHAGWLNMQVSDPTKFMPEMLITAGIWFLVQNGTWIAGLIALVSTMRTRNGHRGLHEVLTGTRVVRIPEKRPRTVAGRFDRGFPSIPLQHPSGLFDRVGPFAVQGAMRWDDGAKVLLGEDASLQRKVWIWLRPADGPGLSADRHALNRAARQRWLMAGELEGQRWDAFVAPKGARLGDLVAAGGPLEWCEARPLLEQLSYELSIAAEEWTLPDALTVDQIWVQPGGRAILTDVPLIPPPAPPADPEVVYSEADRSLGLLWQTSILALEGRARSPGDAELRVRAPLPRYAAELLARLPDSDGRVAGPEEFQDCLAGLREQPDEVSRFRRFVHLVLLAAFSSLWLACCLPTFGMFMSPGFMCLFPTSMLDMMFKEARESLAVESPRDLAVAMAQPDPWKQLAAVAIYQKDQELAARLDQLADEARAERQEVIDRLSPVQRWCFMSWEQIMKGQEQNMRRSMRMGKGTGARQMAANMASEQARPGQILRQFGVEYVLVQVLLLAVWPVLLILWAFALGGALSYRIAGIAVVRRDGRPASRLQCLWRAFLVWAPVGALLVCSVYLDGFYWSGWSDLGWRSRMEWLLSASLILWYAGATLLIAEAALALLYPRRSLHDWLAGTYLVPR